MPIAEERPLWLETSAATDYPPLAGRAEADVAIVGGGIVGLTTALLLKRAGRRVAVVEAQRVGARITGRSTAKLTAQHNLVYDMLVERFGEQAARRYAEFSTAALELVAGIAAEEGIDCDLEQRAAYLYTQDPDRTGVLRREAESAARLGLPAHYTEHTELPFTVAGALRFDEQYQFHPHKYLRGLARAVDGDGCMVFEQTRVLTVRGEHPRRVITDRGSVEARDVVIATGLPILDRGGYFTRAYPRRHLVMAAETEAARALQGMYLSIDTPSRSLRSWRDGERSLLLAVGDGFRPGAEDTSRKHEELARFLREHFGVREPEYWWGNQDYDSADRLPLIGPFLPGQQHLWVATGFNAWGLNLGSGAGMLLRDLILGEPNPAADLFRPARVNLQNAGPRFLEANARVAVRWIGDRVRSGLARSVEDLDPGEAGHVRHGTETVAAYRDGGGALHMVSPNCTHLYCKLQWNAAERSWDCPCHGSRFDIDGRVLQGPAVDDLARKT